MRHASISLAVLCALGGCVTQNQFAGSVAEYNLQTEQAQDRGLVLNVLRASRRRPLTFFDVTTVTGSSPASGSIGVSVPLSQNHTTSRVATTFSPTLALSGGPSVAAGPIVTQEFYRGMLAPISMATVDLFVERGVSRDLLFNLFFQKIEFTTDDTFKDKPGFDAVVTNYPGDDGDVGRFQRAVEWLVDAGLTTKSTDAGTTTYGPLYLPQELVGVDLVARAAAAGLQVNAVSWCDLENDDWIEIATRRSKHITTPAKESIEKAAEACKALKKAEEALPEQNLLAEPNPSAPDTSEAKSRLELTWSNQMSGWRLPPYLYRLEKVDAAPKAVFCYDSEAGLKTVPKTLLCKPPGNSAANQNRNDQRSNLSAPGDIKVLCDILFGYKSEKYGQCAKANGRPVIIKITPRSTYTLVYYLGELARRSLYPDVLSSGEPAPRYIQVRNGDDHNRTCAIVRSLVFKSDHCISLFVVEREMKDTPGFLHLSYDGEQYVVPDPKRATDPRLSGMTYEVLDIVNELVDLNRSAKDVPASNVFTLQGAP